MRKKSIIFITAIATIAIIVSFLLLPLQHLFPLSYHHTFTKTTDLHAENVEDLYVNDEFYNEKITHTYGEQTEQSRNVEKYDYFKLKSGLEVAVNKQGQITRFIVTENSLQTAKGIQIGDSKKAIIHAYGSHYYKRLEQSAQIIGYVDKQAKIALEFWLFDDEVAMIRLDNQSMK